MHLIPRWLCRKLLRVLQRRCPHRSDDVLADYLEGDVADIAVRWCRRCGAIQRVDTSLDDLLACKTPLRLRLPDGDF